MNVWLSAYCVRIVWGRLVHRQNMGLPCSCLAASHAPAPRPVRPGTARTHPARTSCIHPPLGRLVDAACGGSCRRLQALRLSVQSGFKDTLQHRIRLALVPVPGWLEMGNTRATSNQLRAVFTSPCFRYTTFTQTRGYSVIGLSLTVDNTNSALRLYSFTRVISGTHSGSIGILDFFVRTGEKLGRPQLQPPVVEQALCSISLDILTFPSIVLNKQQNSPIMDSYQTPLSS
jgi:hypothetical protein